MPLALCDCDEAGKLSVRSQLHAEAWQVIHWNLATTYSRESSFELKR
jgi:hypothetical protein